MKKYLKLIILSFFIVYGITTIIPNTSASLCNAITICTEPNNQLFTELCSDGDGGVFITWADNRTGLGYDIYAQRVNSSGDIIWSTRGIPIYSGDGEQNYPKICSDRAGGALITWKDNSNSAYIQRLSSNGSLLWNASGVLVCSKFSSYSLYSDNSGGAIVAWKDSDLHAQRINASGALMWDINGTTICNATGVQELLTGFSDEEGNTYFSWQDLRNGFENSDIYVQKVDIDGNILWSPNGTEICTANNLQVSPQICTDGVGGAIVIWDDLRILGKGFSLYGQRINTTGTIQWELNGTLLAYNILSYSARICSDDEEGAIIVYRTSSIRSSYAIRIDSNGTNLYSELVYEVPNSPGTGHIICSDNVGGAFIAWSRGYPYDIFTQRVSSEGSIDWSIAGNHLCVTDDQQCVEDIVSNGLGTAFVSWTSSTLGEEDEDIYLNILKKREDQGTIVFSNFFLAFIFLVILSLVIVSKHQVNRNPKI